MFFSFPSNIKLGADEDAMTSLFLAPRVPFLEIRKVNWTLDGLDLFYELTVEYKATCRARGTTRLSIRKRDHIISKILYWLTGDLKSPSDDEGNHSPFFHWLIVYHSQSS